jgi:transposase
MPRKPKTSRRETTPVERAAIWAHHCNGLTYSQIVEATGHVKSTIASIIQRIKKSTKTDKFSNAKRSGAPRRVDPRGERALLRHADQNTRDPLAVLGTPSKSGKQLSRMTVRKILKRNGKARRRARKKPYLTKKHKQVRFQRCKQHKHLDPMRICWSDEATFEIGHDGSIIWVTRAPGEEYYEKNLKPSFKSGRTSVSVWVAFCGRHMGPVVVLPKGVRMNQQLYKDSILKPHFIPFYRRMKRLYGTKTKPVYLQEDGASYHTAGIPAQYRKAMKVKCLDWPPQSPDLAPIENLWKIVKDRIAKRRHRIKNIEEMGNAIIEEMSKFSSDLLEKLARSFEKRMELCIAAKGGSIKY